MKICICFGISNFFQQYFVNKGNWTYLHQLWSTNAIIQAVCKPLSNCIYDNTIQLNCMQYQTKIFCF